MRNLVAGTEQPYLNHHTSALAAAQERAALVERGWSAQVGAPSATPAVYKLYTEDVVKPVSSHLATHGFDGATLYHTTGIYRGQVERGLTIEIVDTLDARKRIIALALDIAIDFAQTEVLVTWQSSKGFETVRVFGK